MRPTNVTQVLVFAAGLDRRIGFSLGALEDGDAEVRIMQEAWESVLAPLDGWEKSTEQAWLDVRDAIREHYSTSTRPIMAFDVLDGVRRRRAARLELAPPFEPAAYGLGADASAEEERAALADHRQRAVAGLPPRQVPPQLAGRRRPVGELLARAEANTPDVPRR